MWKPISTAPRVGPVLGWMPGRGSKRVDAGDVPGVLPGFMYVCWRTQPHDDMWCYFEREEDRLHFKPTHWMPLPEPPK